MYDTLSADRGIFIHKNKQIKKSQNVFQIYI
jgi:hypothetical protein